MNTVYTVKQLTHYIKNMFSQDFLLGKVSVTGEVSNLKYHPTGHIYFSLKDSDAVISCVMFAGSRFGLKCQMKEGMKVNITGSVDVYEAGGRYQLYAKEIREEGRGDLFQTYLELKNRLEEMGMFDAAYKKPIPKYAMTVGVVTASSGAALQDIINISGRRNPYVKVILSPALVQGEGAPESIVKAIERLDAVKPDVMIVGRGGGSIEDLWAFNDERVARAIFEANTPIISAVGHETDFTIADFVSDLRAPTPSAAAELAFFDANAYLERLVSFESLMTGAVQIRIDNFVNRLDKDRMRLKLSHPLTRIERQAERLQNVKDRLQRGAKTIFDKRDQRLSLLSGKLDGLSPLRKLRGGYGYLTKDGIPVTDAFNVKTGDALRVRMEKGSIYTAVERVEKDE